MNLANKEIIDLIYYAHNRFLNFKKDPEKFLKEYKEKIKIKND